MGMSKTSKQSQSIDPKIAAAATALIPEGQRLSRLPFVPNKGITVAGFTPMQQAAFKGVGDMASAFGMPSVSNPMAGMPATQHVNGISGYSLAPYYNQMQNASMKPNLINRFKQ